MEQLTLFPADILANLSRSPGNNRETPTSVTYGENFTDSSKSFDLLGSLARTYSDTLATDSTSCVVTWNEKVSKFGQSYYKLQMSERHTSVNGSSWLLATPTASQSYKKIRQLAPSEANGKHGKVLPGSIGEKFPSYIGMYPNPAFVEWMMGFPEDWTKID